MTTHDVEVVTSEIASLVRETLAPLVARLVALEAREAVPGRDGRDGVTPDPDMIQQAITREVARQVALVPVQIGPPGPVGARGERGECGDRGADAVVPADWITRLAAIEHARADEASVDELAQTAATWLRRELCALSPPPLMQKRLVRDVHGRIERVVEEPA